MGQAVYTEDLPLPLGTFYGAILRSPYAMHLRYNMPHGDIS